MKNLCYETLKDIGYKGCILKDAPERIFQFDEGNFLRAFVECWIDKMNETAVSTLPSPRSHVKQSSRR